MIDPLAVTPLYLGQTLPPGDDHQECRTRVRFALAAAGIDTDVFAPMDHRNNIGQIMEQLGRTSCFTAILDRVEGHVFLAMIPGPGELEITSDWLANCLYTVPDVIVLPFADPLQHVVLFFNDRTGLSSCRDYVLLGTACLNCQGIEPCVDNMCQTCTKALEEDTRLVEQDSRARELQEYLLRVNADQPQPV